MLYSQMLHCIIGFHKSPPKMVANPMDSFWNPCWRKALYSSLRCPGTGINKSYEEVRPGFLLSERAWRLLSEQPVCSWPKQSPHKQLSRQREGIRREATLCGSHSTQVPSQVHAQTPGTGAGESLSLTWNTTHTHITKCASLLETL